MTARAALDRLLGAAQDWHAALPALSGFCPWPIDLRYQGRAANALPHIPLMQTNPGTASNISLPLQTALLDAALHVEWRHTYTEKEVGRDFLNAFGWFELAGPSGHFITHQTRMTVGYWGPGLDYGLHQHRAEELYSVVSGQALFIAKGEANRLLNANDTRLHQSDQPHAMKTAGQPVLTFVLWRGEGLDDPPRMSA